MKTNKLERIKESNKRKALKITLSTLITNILIKGVNYATDVIPTAGNSEITRDESSIIFAITTFWLLATGIPTTIFTIIMIINKVKKKETSKFILLFFICSIVAFILSIIFRILIAY